MVYILQIFIIYFSKNMLGCQANTINKKEYYNKNYKILQVFDHNIQNFTQGLLIHNNFLYESTGLYGKSKIFKYQIEDKILKNLNNKPINNKYFGEGITIFNNKLFQLTWKAQKVLIYKLDGIKFIESKNFQTTTKEGWGITHNKDHLIVSDGSEYLHFWNPNYKQQNTMIPVKKLKVTYQNKKVTKLNELELYIDKYNQEYVLANIWRTNKIAIIDLSTGIVKKMLDFTYLNYLCNNKNKNVLNGIAYDKKKNMFYITGKYWDKIFCIKIDI